jgi:HSP20 family molecular chaperone IbpA
MNIRAFPNASFLIGFDRLERLLERSQRASSEGYPPYNVEELPGDSEGNTNGSAAQLRLTLAVAGFARDELCITVEDSQLVIRGKQIETEGKTFLHRGIAARQFLRSFVLADGIEVSAAALEHGLLKIDLVRPSPERAVRTIEIRTGGIG